MAARKNKLTDKQEKFVQNLLLGQSQREAYKNSYNANKMKDNTIDRRASEIANKSEVKARLDELHGKVRQKAEDKAIFTAEGILQDLRDLIDRNKINDDKTALDGIKTAMKHLGMFIDKVEVSQKTIVVGDIDDE